MGRGLTAIASVLLLAAATPACATEFTAVISDQDGKPVPNAVVTLVPDSANAMPAANTKLPAEGKIDQRDETFLPLVTIVAKGGRVVFSNNDQTTHQVYSFSKVKQFELTLSRGQTSSVDFQTPGIAALGCNIHDRMIAYVFVTESPWTGATRADGTLVLKDVPAGSYRVQVWHPRVAPGRPLPSVNLALSGDTARWQATVRVLPARLTRIHGGNY